MDKKDAEYTQARIDLLEEMLKAGAFDMDAETRGGFVAAAVRQLKGRYRAIDEPLWRKLISDGRIAVYGDATLAVAARRGRGPEPQAPSPGT